MDSGILEGSRILVVEDEYFLADDACATLAQSGAEIVGPVATVVEASALIVGGGPIDCVLLDVNLRGEMAFDVADACQIRKIPFAFVTGYDREALPERFAAAPTMGKPIDSENLIALFVRLTAMSRDLNAVGDPQA